MSYLPRNLQSFLENQLNQRPAVYLNGPRQAGKSTLVEHLAQPGAEIHYLTMDHYATLHAATNDPEGFLRSLSGIVILDEIQAAPSLFRPLKEIIDEQRRAETPVKFLLTGSINILSLPSLADALVGRMSVLTLYPFSVAEANRFNVPKLIDWFEKPIEYKQLQEIPFSINELIQSATFPELVTHPDINRYQWFEDYVTTLLYRDIRALSEIEKALEIPKMLRLLAARVGGLLNDANTAGDLGISVSTYRRYRALLEQVFLIKLIPPWFSNISKRLVKSPKLFFTDTALLCYALAVNLENIQQHLLYGHILENFVATELLKQINTAPIHLYHFRTQSQQEVDFVLERSDGQLLGIEVKAKSKIDAGDLRGLLALRELAKDKFCRGIILYQGKDIYSLGHDCYAVPITAWCIDLDKA